MCILYTLHTQIVNKNPVFDRKRDFLVGYAGEVF